MTKCGICLGLLLLCSQVAVAQEVVTIQNAKVSLIDEIDVPARLAETLAELNVKEGDLVQEGELIGKLDDTMARHELEVAEAEHAIKQEASENDINLRFAVKSSEVANKEVERAREARKTVRGTISDTEFERLVLTEEKSILQIEQAQHDLKISQLEANLQKVKINAAQATLKKHQILAPFSGQVVEIYPHMRKGGWVNPGDPILRIARLDRLRVEAYLDAEKYGPGLVGRPVTLTIPKLGGSTQVEFKGKVVFVNPEVEPVSKRFTLTAEVNNDENFRLWPGMSGSLTIDLGAKIAENR